MRWPLRLESRQGLFLVLVILLSAFLSACGAAQNFLEGIQLTSPATTITPTPFQPLSPDTPTPLADVQLTYSPTDTPESPQPTPEPTETPQPITAIPGNSVWIAPYVPAQLREGINLPDGFSSVESPGTGQVNLEVSDQQPVSHWIYALVAPFPTITDQVSVRDLKQSWKGNPNGPFSGQPLLMDESTYGVLTTWWGDPGSDSTRILPSGDLLDIAWDQRPSWAIVPFESLDPGWKVIAIDDQSPLRKEFDPDSYALSVPFSLMGDSSLVAELQSNSSLPATNRDASQLTTVAMTGVTALVRATAFSMHRNGITYPARDIGQVLRSADLTHISNEIPFTPDCPPPNPVQEGLRFCSDPDYIALLEEVGTDVVELTGDHFGDWGPEAMLYTLDMYEQRDWTYYGGGYDRKDARQARQIEHNGNKIAFIGCNAKGGGYATASESQPGAVACDFDWMQTEIARLTEAGYQVIATFQHFEYYTYTAQPNQVRDSRLLAEAGASIVSGSQAHQPQGLEFYKNAFIHYGLGNLFFDQYHFCTDYACDDGFIDLHVFYDGEYIGSELVTIVFEDYARPRLTSQEERSELLQKVFSASSW
ncbi:CapA family protein [Chloroflexota bacterium]